MSDGTRTVLWIDAHLEYRSPTMRHLLHSLPRLRAEGWTVKAWCLRSDAPPSEVEHVFFPAPRWLGPFELLYFTLAVNLYGLWRWLRRRPRPAEIIHATCGTYLAADVTSVHFLNCVWARTQIRLGFSDWREAARYPFVLLGACAERLQWWSPSLRLALAVSDSVTTEVRRRTRAAVRVETMANSYDETRFNPARRETCRPQFRNQLGIHAGDIVFVFASFGHYKRKGFWLALAALSKVREAGRNANVRFLIVGGTPEAVEALQSQIGNIAPDWREWMIFTGSQTAVEDYFAASDALIFPSYFETYALVALEAAAMGLPVLLTPFHGSEMTLHDGENGVLLSYDPEAMSRQIGEYIRQGLPNSKPGPGRGLTRAQYAEALLAVYEGLSDGPTL